MKENIAIQGGLGSFHEAAAKSYFNQEHHLVECETFGELIRAVKSGKAKKGVMAIENSVAGSILPNYARIQESGLKITGEVFLRIHQHLMALPGETLQSINEVNSHPMAILQCEAFFKDHPHMRLVEKPDTALSAKAIAQRKLLNRAAIASEGASQLYGLEIIAREIETNKRNYTRFLIIETESNLQPDCQKASLCFQAKHEPGSLAKILSAMAENDINMTKIQSLPVVGQEFTYLFHCDLIGKNRTHLEQVFKKIDKLCLNMEILGVYKLGSHNTIN